MKGLDYRKVRDDAAAAGTLGHEMIDARIHDVPPAVPVDATEEQIAQAKVALRAFDRWSQSVGMKILVTELPLVSERHRFGGTLDGLGRVADGALAILDFKTGKVFPEHILQLAAYAELVGECRGETVEEAYLLRVSRESGNFSYHQYDRATLDTGIEAFLLMRKLYDYDSKLKKAC
jgi:RecB family exonuclease